MMDARLSTYELARAEVINFLESRHGLRVRDTRIQRDTRAGNDPMDVDSFQQKGKSRGKGKGKDKGKAKGGKAAKSSTGSSGGSYGNHGGSYTSSSSSAAGAGAGRGGSSNRSASIQGSCWHCGKTGHRAADCRSKGKGKGSKSKSKGKGKHVNSLEQGEDTS